MCGKKGSVHLCFLMKILYLSAFLIIILRLVCAGCQASWGHTFWFLVNSLISLSIFHCLVPISSICCVDVLLDLPLFKFLILLQLHTFLTSLLSPMLQKSLYQHTCLFSTVFNIGSCLNYCLVASFLVISSFVASFIFLKNLISVKFTLLLCQRCMYISDVHM